MTSVNITHDIIKITQISMGKLLNFMISPSNYFFSTKCTLSFKLNMLTQKVSDNPSCGHALLCYILWLKED